MIDEDKWQFGTMFYLGKRPRLLSHISLPDLLDRQSQKAITAMSTRAHKRRVILFFPLNCEKKWRVQHKGQNVMDRTDNSRRTKPVKVSSVTGSSLSCSCFNIFACYNYVLLVNHVAQFPNSSLKKDPNKVCVSHYLLVFSNTEQCDEESTLISQFSYWSLERKKW